MRLVDWEMAQHPRQEELRQAGKKNNSSVTQTQSRKKERVEDKSSHEIQAARGRQMNKSTLQLWAGGGQMRAKDRLTGTRGLAFISRAKRRRGRACMHATRSEAIEASESALGLFEIKPHRHRSRLTLLDDHERLRAMQACSTHISKSQRRQWNSRAVVDKRFEPRDLWIPVWPWLITAVPLR